MPDLTPAWPDGAGPHGKLSEHQSPDSWWFQCVCGFGVKGSSRHEVFALFQAHIEAEDQS